MAQIPQPQAENLHGKIRSKKLSTRIDMTPMVDLAFLLLTFFLLTAVFSKPYVLQLDMPQPPETDAQTPRLSAPNAFYLILGPDDKIFWWVGDNPTPQESNYSEQGLRELLLTKKAENPDLMVLIKPMKQSKYRNVVDVLDEMGITKMPRYALLDFTDEDKMVLKR